MRRPVIDGSQGNRGEAGGMNSLSWMLYLADVSRGITIGMASLIAASSLGIFMMWVSHCIDGNRAPPKWLHIITALAIFLVAIIPSRDTIYAIAVSEMGEDALKSKTDGKAFTALDAWLDKQVEKAQ
jgi:DMSO reductase anchor subunit